MKTAQDLARQGLTVALLSASLGVAGVAAASATTIDDAGFGIDWSANIGDGGDFDQLGGVSSLSTLTVTEPVLDFDDLPDGTGTAKFRADLATGELGLSTEVQSPERAAEIDAAIFMVDTIQIDLSSFEVSDALTFNFASSVEGSLGYATDEDDFLETAVVDYGLSLKEDVGGGISFFPLRFGVTYEVDDSGLSGSGSLDLTDSRVTQGAITTFRGDFGSSGKTEFSGTFDLSGGELYEFEFRTFLGIEGPADFLGTATFDLTGPVPIGSTSGTFLSSSVTPVPVPAALPLLAAGLGAMAFASRRRRRA